MKNPLRMTGAISAAARAQPLIRRIAQEVPVLWVPAPEGDAKAQSGERKRDEAGAQPPQMLHTSLGLSGDSIAVAWMSPPPEAVAEGRMVPCAAADYVAEALRAGCTGLLFDPDSRRSTWLGEAQMRDLLRECLLPELSGLTPWTTVRDGKPVVMVLAPGYRMLPAYRTRDEAEQALDLGEEAQPVSWDELWRRLHETASAAILLGAGSPAAVTLDRSDIAQILGDGRRTPLDLLEEAIRDAAEPGGGDFLVAALAAVDYIWTLANDDGNPVGPPDTAAVFTSARHVSYGESLLRPLFWGNRETTLLYPRALPARELWQKLLERYGNLRLVINLGSESAWEGPVAILSRVLSLSAGERSAH